MTEEKIETLNRVGLKLVALRQNDVHLGCIMSPEEVFNAANEPDTAEQVRADGAWSLCGDTSSEMFKLLRDGAEVAMRFTVFGYGKQQYLVIAHQIRSLQHRFIMPLYEAAVREFLAHAVRGVIWFSFGDNGNKYSVILRSISHQRDLGPVLAMAPKYEPQDKVEALSKLLDATHDLSRIHKVPSFYPGYAVNKVSTTVVAPRTAGDVDGSMAKHAEELPCRY